MKTTIIYQILRRATVAQTSRAVARGFFMTPSIPSRKRRASVADVAGSKQTVAQAPRKRRASVADVAGYVGEAKIEERFNSELYLDSI